jgi:4-alpha-glucanotransferase
LQSKSKPSLGDLCRLYSVQTMYRDVFGKVRRPPNASLLKVLRSLGAELEGLSDVTQAYRARLAQLKSRVVEPVLVLFDGSRSLPIKLEEHSDNKIVCRLRLEGEEKVREWVINASTQPVKDFTLRAPFDIPFGYHRLDVRVGDSTYRSLVIAAPSKAYQQKSRVWGLFIPLYALHSRRSWGAGTYTDILNLIKWASRVGASFVGTTPLLPFNPSAPFDPSPYSPSSRLFWSDFYVDLNTPSTLKLLDEGLRKKLREVVLAKRVGYEDIIQIKTHIAAKLAQKALKNRNSKIVRYIKEHPELEEFARFRAARESEQIKGFEKSVSQHLYLQALAHLQFEQVSHYAKRVGVGLYLDLPLGCSPEGYDAWRYSDLFVKDVSVGAPPDFFFPRGQNWGINPLHPEKIREAGYSYFMECVRHHMRHAGYLRLDHIMALHRLYWIPKGAGSGEGVYVKYRAEEFYAIICLESHRHRCVVVGENLGTVPSYVNRSLRRHGLLGCFILQLKHPQTIEQITPNTLAALNTHDMPTFKAYLNGLDITLRHKMGLISDQQAAKEREQRKQQIKELKQYLKDRGLLKEEHSLEDLLAASLKMLASSSAKLLLISLEDLWLEEAVHNIPGTGAEAGNWRHRSELSLERIVKDTRVRALLEMVAEARRSAS